MFKKALQFILRLAARAVLRKYDPKIVGVTGSVGKTTTKDAITAVLRKEFTVWTSSGNYNNEIGLPLAVLNASSGKRNLLLWFLVFVKFIRLMFGSKYPKVLVLEMAADRVGDIEYLTRIAPPSIAVVTKVGEAHLEYFGDIETVQAEKSKLVEALSFDGVAVLNFDDARVLAMKSQNSGKTVSFGLGEGADIRAFDIEIIQAPQFRAPHVLEQMGLGFKICDKEGETSIFIKNSLGHPQVYAALAAYVVGGIMGVSKEKIVQALKKLPLPPGRLRPLGGIKMTMLLDDTYNSSPEATVEALKVLKQMRSRRRIAVLGDMLELGANTENYHRRIGRLVYDMGIDMLFTVGERAKFIADEARKNGFAKSRIFEYATSLEASRVLQNKMQQGDVVLIKGSQAVRLERLVEEVMAEPEKAGSLLCRQEESWKQRT